MTWPKRYGGGERSFLERYTVTEELLAAGAPVGCHWIADRQSGPLLLRYGTEPQRQEFLPGITKGEIFFAIGMSEPDSGSDLASIRTRATPVCGGYEVTGAKVWTSYAHESHYAITLVRTGGSQPADRHRGLSQLILDLKTEGVSIRPIRNLAGEHDFNEIVLDRVLVPANRLVGNYACGWMFAACLPFGPVVISKLTRWFSARDLKPAVLIAEKCANRSSPPSSGLMKP